MGTQPQPTASAVIVRSTLRNRGKAASEETSAVKEQKATWARCHFYSRGEGKCF